MNLLTKDSQTQIEGAIDWTHPLSPLKPWAPGQESELNKLNKTSTTLYTLHCAMKTVRHILIKIG